MIQKCSAFVFLLLSILLASCTDPSNNSGSTPTSGEWKVVYFFDKQDETSHYNGYVFDFGSNGSLSATKNGQSWTGNWSTGFDDSKDKMLLSFTGAIPSELSDLQEDWLILKMNNNVMQFEHTSGGNGDTDVLHFEHI